MQASMTYDLAIRGGTLVGPGGQRAADVYVAEGRIAAVGTDKMPAAVEVDAAGLLVMPGMIDAHVHLMDPGDPTREDFPTGTAAAAKAGVTTVIEHTHASPVLTVADLEAKVEHLATRSRIDYALAAHVMPGELDEIGALHQAGVAFLKAFTCTTHGLIGFSPAQLRDLLVAVAETSAVCLVHCEDESLIEAAAARLRQAKRDDGGVIPEWRNLEAELVAVGYTTLLARTTGARVVIAHVSNPDAVEMIADERRRGADVLAESCPQYLQMFEDDVLTHGAFRKFTPPARARTRGDLEAMWQAVRDGAIALLSSDHAPATRQQKTSGSIWDVHFGLPGIDTTFAVLLTAAAAGRVSYERIVEAYSATPAAIYGLGHRKGRIDPGMDADLVLVDPECRWTMTADTVLSRAEWSPYEGMAMSGAVVRAYCRGVLISENGNVLAAPGDGEFVPAVHEREQA